MSQRKQPGKLFIFEGPDGVGKSTISNAIWQYLTNNGVDCELITFPGKEKGTVGQVVYTIHHDPASQGITELTPTCRQALHIAAHLDTIERRIFPALQSGRHVLLDRFWWSTWVYGRVGKMDRTILKKMIEVELAQWGSIKPALAFLLRRSAPIDRQEDPLYWHSLSHEYAALIRREKHQHPVLTLDNQGTLTDAITKAQEVIAQYLPALQKKAKKRTDQKGQQIQLPLVTERPTAPVLLLHLLPAKPTPAFDTYWRFAAERQSIFFKRITNAPPPWTTDHILGTWKFTNAYRASDRVSQFLIRHVIYRDDLPNTAEEVFFRILLFKLFNKIETWQLLESSLGTVTYADYSYKHFERILNKAKERGKTIYSAAYIMPSGGKAFGSTRKHRSHLRLIERMMQDELPQKLADAPNMQRGFELLLGYPTIGDFLAYQFITDVNYSTITNFSEMDFVVPGPGALDGIRKCFADLGGLNEPEIIRLMVDRQEEEFARLGLNFQNLWGRRLQLIDCQNLFCEVDKYARVAHPEITGISGRLRIKQKHIPKHEPLPCWYPPKWKINEALIAWFQGSAIASPTHIARSSTNGLSQLPANR